MSDKVTFAEITQTLTPIDLRAKFERKKDSSNATYLSWADAWAELIKIYPNSVYEVKTFGENHLPYLKTSEGYLVWTKVSIEGNEREMWLPVMDSGNRAMLDHPYEIVTSSGKKIQVNSATMNDINRAIMRCLVKNIAMFGLAINVYRGEDIPDVEEAPVVEPPHICECCGSKIEAVKNHTAKEFAEGTKNLYGQELCYSCYVKKKQEMAQKPTEKPTEGNQQ